MWVLPVGRAVFVLAGSLANASQASAGRWSGMKGRFTPGTAVSLASWHLWLICLEFEPGRDTAPLWKAAVTERDSDSF